MHKIFKIILAFIGLLVIVFNLALAVVVFTGDDYSCSNSPVMTPLLTDSPPRTPPPKEGHGKFMGYNADDGVIITK